jgi:hypothetical protein
MHRECELHIIYNKMFGIVCKRIIYRVHRLLQFATTSNQTQSPSVHPRGKIGVTDNVCFFLSKSYDTALNKTPFFFFIIFVSFFFFLETSAHKQGQLSTQQMSQRYYYSETIRDYKRWKNRNLFEKGVLFPDV